MLTFSWPVQKDNYCVYKWNIESGSIDDNEKVETYFKDIISTYSVLQDNYYWNLVCNLIIF